MRARLASVATVNESERMLLLRLFRGHDMHGDGLASLQTFVDVWRRLSVRLSTDQATLLFRKYGMDTQGLLPYAVFVQAFLTSPSRVLGLQGLQRGAFRSDGSGADFKGKIVYRMGSTTCRKPVFAPTDWDPQLALRSASPPDSGLELEFIYGYSGKFNTTSNIFFTASGEVVYYTAGVGIVYDRHGHRQRFFTGHDDDIKCIAMHPRRRIVATGQMCGHAETSRGLPYVCIWDTKTCKELACIPFPPEGEPSVAMNSVAALGFSSCGSLLAIVTGDTNHTVHVFEWRRGAQGRICNARGYKGEPPQVYGAVWNPFLGPDKSWKMFVTFGAKHLKFWTTEAKGGRYSSSLARHGGGGSGGGGVGLGSGIDDVTSAEFLSSSRLWTGSRRGDIYEWNCDTGVCMRRYEAAHGCGTPVEDPADRQLRHGGIRSLRLRASGVEVLSAGADGKVKTWDVSGLTSNGSEARCSAVLELPASYSTKRSPPQIRALDCMPGSDVFIAGTHRCDLWEVDDTPEVLVFGHSDEVYCAAFHPLVSSKVVTASFSSFIFVWNLKKRVLVTKCSAGFKVRSVAFSNPDGSHLAIGGVNGKMIVLNASNLSELVAEWHVCESAISVLSYSPQGAFLAAGSHDNCVDIFAAKQGYRRVARCSGSSSYITHLTWSAGGEILMVTDGAYEILYFESSSGFRKSTSNHRDTLWADWTCVLGFPVMGIWPDGSDGTDINSLHRSHDGRFVATADDYGMIKIFNWPCVVENARHRGYRGHSSHVTMCRFSPDDSRLITTGGVDRAVFQWRLCSAAPEPPKAPTGIKVIDVVMGANARNGRQPPSAYPDDADVDVGDPLRMMRGDVKTNVSKATMIAYRVTVWTSDIRGAGTSADVMLIVHGSGGHTRSLRLEGSEDDFSRGKCDEFSLSAADVGVVEKITIGHNNAGMTPSWHLREVLVLARGTATRFPCNDWLDAELGDGVTRTLTPSGTRSSVKRIRMTVVTSDIRGAGTEANVQASLVGSLGNVSGPHRLDNCEANFSRGRTDIFELSAALDVVEKLRIGHDGRGAVCAWHLATICLEAEGMPTVHFEHNAWLSAADGTSEVVLLPTTASSSTLSKQGHRDGLGPDDTYRIETQTGSHRNASSDANVYVKLLGSRYASAPLKLDNAKDNFERGKHDVFELRMPDLGEIHEIEVWQDETGPSPDWFLEDVYLQNERTMAFGYYVHNSWVTSKHSVLKRAETNDKFHYTIIVETSKVRGASTDANVAIQLIGSASRTEKMPLGAGTDSFRQGVVDTFSFDLPDLGSIDAIEIGHDNFDAGRYGPGWHLRRVEVRAGRTGESFHFFCDAWLDAGKGDRLTWRRLVARAESEMPTMEVVYDCVVRTSDIRSAGTSANVFVQVFGDSGQSAEIALDDANASFSRSSEEVFPVPINEEEVGKINALSVWHDNSGPAPDWHLASIVLTRRREGHTGTTRPPNSNRTTSSAAVSAAAADDTKDTEQLHFHCDQWLSLVKGQQLLRLDLFPSSASELAARAEREYVITVHTSDIRFAGTDASVYCRLHGDGVTTEAFLLENSADNFERNKTDRFYIRGIDVGQWQSLEIWHDNSGLGAGWHLDYVKVKDEAAGVEMTFPCGSWLDAAMESGCRATLLPSGGEEQVYELTVKTSHERGAGTDARVSVMLIGAQGSSGPHLLPENSKTNFDRDKEDFFVIAPGHLGADVGRLTHLEVSAEGGFLSPNWKLLYVQVKHVHGTSSETLFFHCDAWLNAQNGRTVKLKATDASESASKSVHSYSITTYTSDVRGAGTDANVTCTIRGSLGVIEAARLENSMNNFRRGMPDTFLLMSRDIGDLEELVIEHDGSGLGSSWHLAEIHVRNVDTLHEATFPCNAWLDRHQPPHMTRMTLLPASRGGKAFVTTKYEVRTYTGDARGAGTSSNIRIKLFGSESTSSELVLDTSSWDFRRGADDTFVVETLHLGAIQAVELISDYSGISPGWFCEHVSVTELPAEEEGKDTVTPGASGETSTAAAFPHSFHFAFECWLDAENKRVKRKASRHTYDDTLANRLYYEVTTWTCDERGAGTVCEVYILINGDKGSTGRCILDERADDFFAGKETTFIVGPVQDLGDVTSIVIGHDGRGRGGTSIGSSWKLDRVRVVNTVRNTTWDFSFNDWISREKGLEVTLLPEGSSQGGRGAAVCREAGVAVDENLCDYEISVMTGAGRGAGTSSTITLSIYGELGFIGENVLDDQFARFAAGCVDSFRLRGADVGTFQKVRT